jgi:cell division protease FtsH
MVCRFGMSDAVGPVTFAGNASPRFSPWSAELGPSMSVSEETLQLVDAEVKAVLLRERVRAYQTLARQSSALDAIARELLTHETLQREELEALIAPVRAPTIHTGA